METANVFMCDFNLAQEIKRLLIFAEYYSGKQEIQVSLGFEKISGKPKINIPIKVFNGREWFMSILGDEELGPEYKGEKFDIIFLSAESLRKYYGHDYKMDLRTILEKYGNEQTKVIIFRCSVCVECNDFVRHKYTDVDFEFADQNYIFKYFNEYIVFE